MLILNHFLRISCVGVGWVAFLPFVLNAQVSMRSTTSTPDKQYLSISSPALATNIDTLFARAPGSSTSTFPSILLTPQSGSPGTPEGTLYYNDVTNAMMLEVSGSWVQVLTTADVASVTPFNIAAAGGAAVTPYTSTDLLNLDAGLTSSVNPRVTVDAATNLMTIIETGYYHIEGSSGFHTHHGSNDMFTLSLVINGTVAVASSQTSPHNHVPGYSRTTLTTYLASGTTVGLAIETVDTGGTQLASTLTVRKIG